MWSEAVLEFGEEKRRFVNESNYRNSLAPRIDNVETVIEGEGTIPAKVLCFIKQDESPYNFFWREKGDRKPPKKSKVFVLVHFYKVLSLDNIMGKQLVQLYDPTNVASYMVLPFGAVKGHAYIVPYFGKHPANSPSNPLMFWDQIWH